MPTSQKMLKCRQCGKATLHLKQHPSHVLHFFLSLFTVGLWLPIWFLLALTSGAPTCSQCGTKVGSFRLT